MPLPAIALCAIISSSFGLTEPGNRRACSYVPEIIAQAKNNNIEPTLLVSVIMVESAFRPRVVSIAGACGLTQVVPKWTGGPETKYKKYTCSQLKDPKTAIRVGAQMLSYSIRVYGKGNLDTGLCVYNAGTICLKSQKYVRRLYYTKKVKSYKTIIDDKGC